MLEFNNKILVIGYGSVSKCTLPILLKHIKVPYKNVTVIDFVDQKAAIKEWTDRGVKYFQEKITPINMAQELARHVGAGGMVIDLAWNIGCIDIVSWCHDNNVLYVNTSVEEWDPYADIHNKTTLQKSLYYRQMKLREMESKWNGDSATVVVDHGANPGLIGRDFDLLPALADRRARCVLVYDLC
ncbi:MAG: saccharopine dehydrogenase NADP-binding domain-containing protein, partial [Candidatus Omnitrophica bacterium]|nr:saccharopine dehydrogenase NADP-binding domain-containing protein [Candidatus Omnitrophota bacterium]